MGLQKTFYGVISVTSCFAVFISVCRLVIFLSDFKSSIDVKTYETERHTLTWAVLVDMALLCIFALQHSLMAHPSVKEAMSNLGMHVVQRSLYTLASSIALLTVIGYWQPIPTWWLWKIGTPDSKLCWLFYILHGCGWFSVIFDSLLMDPGELLGLKQVYYSICDWSDPMVLKSEPLRRLLSHRRHASFIGFCFIFWLVPFMSLDRLLLATIWTAYMLHSWQVDIQDYMYVTNQLHQKENELATAFFDQHISARMLR